ncbi:MAG TPA: fatty acid desaturase [Polyangiaceae bacterium]
MILVLTSVLLPFAAYLFLHPDCPAALLIPYAALLLFYVGPFTGLVHEMSHRKIFRSRALQLLVLGILGPLYGLGPSLFRTHHVGMHHPENNLADDLTSTETYRRDSIVDFGQYYFRFLFLTLPELLAYLRRHRRSRMMRQTIGGGAFHVLIVALGLFVNWRAALPLLIGSIVVTRFVLAAGNWAQHAFIDPADPADPLCNSTTCINTRFNHVAFNGGYHTTHHERVGAHWSERPAILARDLDRYRSRGAVVFEGIDFGVVFLALMAKRHVFLARHRVHFGGARRDSEAIVAELRQRTRPIRLSQKRPVPSTPSAPTTRCAS